MARRAPKPTDTPADSGGDTPTRGKHKAKTAADNAPAKLDEATYQHHVEMIQARCLELDEKLREVAGLRGVLAAAKKAAKKAGVPVDAVMKALGLKKRPAGEVVAEFRDIGRVLKILDAPLGTQWGLFNDVETVDVMDADAAGYHASKNNEGADNNPHQAGTEEHQKWHGGWLRHQMEMTESMRPKTQADIEAASTGDLVKEKLRREFEDEGAEAYKAGTEISANPYGDNAHAHAYWRRGWVDAQKAKAGVKVDDSEPPAFLDRRKKRGEATEGATAH